MKDKCLQAAIPNLESYRIDSVKLFLQFGLISVVQTAMQVCDTLRRSDVYEIEVISCRTWL